VQTLREVLKVSNGDMRKAITFMQSAAALHGGVVTPEGVIEISGIFPDRDTEATMEAIKSGSFESCKRQSQNIVAAGYGMSTVLDKVRPLASINLP
jgi:replication factor C subunit 2/4